MKYFTQRVIDMKIKIGWGDGLVLLGNNPLLQPLWAKIHHFALLDHNGSIARIIYITLQLYCKSLWNILSYFTNDSQIVFYTFILWLMSSFPCGCITDYDVSSPKPAELPHNITVAMIKWVGFSGIAGNFIACRMKSGGFSHHRDIAHGIIIKAGNVSHETYLNSGKCCDILCYHTGH